MIHSASLRATGSLIAASAWVASAGLCLRTSSRTFSNASVSAFEVDEVAATAAAGGGLRTGGKAACWRVAGVMMTAPGAAVLGTASAAGGVFFVDACRTRLRPIGRGFGNGTFGCAHASASQAEKPTARARHVASAVDGKAAERLDRVTTSLRGESFDRGSPSST